MGGGSIAPRVPKSAIICDNGLALRPGHFISSNNWIAGWMCGGCMVDVWGMYGGCVVDYGLEYLQKKRVTCLCWGVNSTSWGYLVRHLYWRAVISSKISYCHSTPEFCKYFKFLYNAP